MAIITRGYNRCPQAVELRWIHTEAWPGYNCISYQPDRVQGQNEKPYTIGI